MFPALDWTGSTRLIFWVERPLMLVVEEDCEVGEITCKTYVWKASSKLQAILQAKPVQSNAAGSNNPEGAAT